MEESGVGQDQEGNTTAFSNLVREDLVVFVKKRDPHTELLLDVLYAFGVGLGGRTLSLSLLNL